MTSDNGNNADNEECLVYLLGILNSSLLYKNIHKQ